MKRYPLFSLFVVLFSILSFGIQAPNQIKSSILPNGSFMLSPHVIWQLEQNENLSEIGKHIYLSKEVISIESGSIPRFRGNISSLENITLLAVNLTASDQALEIKVLGVSSKDEQYEGYDVAEITVEDTKLTDPHLIFIKQNERFYFIGYSLKEVAENKYEVAVLSQEMNNLVDSTIAKQILGEEVVLPKEKPKTQVVQNQTQATEDGTIKLLDVTAEKNKELRALVGYSKSNPSIPGVFTAPNRLFISSEVKGIQYSNGAQTSRALTFDPLIRRRKVNKLLTPIILDKYAPFSSAKTGNRKFNSTFYLPIPVKPVNKTPNYTFKKFVLTEGIWKFKLNKIDLPENHLQSFHVPLLAYINNRVFTLGMFDSKNGECTGMVFFGSKIVREDQFKIAQSLLQPKKVEELVGKKAYLHDILIENIKLHDSVLPLVFETVKKEYLKGKNIYVFNKEKNLAVKFRIYNLPENNVLDINSFYISKHFDENSTHNLFVRTQDKKSWINIGTLLIDQNEKQTIQLHYGELGYKVGKLQKLDPATDYLHHVSGQTYLSSSQYTDKFDKNNLQANNDEVLYVKSTLIDDPKEQKIHGTNTPKEYLGKTFIFYYKTKEDKKRSIAIKLDEYTDARNAYGWFSQKSSIGFSPPLDFKEYLPFAYVLEGNKEVLVGFLLKSNKKITIYLFNKDTKEKFDNLETTLTNLEKEGKKVSVIDFDKLKKSNKHGYKMFIKPHVIYFDKSNLYAFYMSEIEKLGGDWASNKEIANPGGFVFKSDPKKLGEDLAYATVKPIEDPSALSNKEIYMTLDDMGLRLAKFQLPKISNKARSDLIFPWIENLNIYRKQAVYIKEENEFKLIGIANKKYLVPLNYFEVNWITPELYEKMTK